MLDTLRCSMVQKANTMYSRCSGFDSSFWHLLSNLSHPCSSQFPFLFVSSSLCVLFFFFSVFLFHFKVFHWHQTCLPLPEPLVSHCLSNPLHAGVLNQNPVNPTSNGVYWERYQTWLLGLVLWPSYIHEKQGFSTICPTAFQSPLWKILDF